MKQTSPVAAQVAFGLVAALALAGTFRYYQKIDQKNRYYQDPRETYLIGIQQERLRGAIAMFPPDVTVGYIGDLPVRRDADWPTDGEFVFTAVRYALAPRLVIPYENGKKLDWVLGDFSKPVNPTQIEIEDGLKLVKDFGSGVVVFRSQ